MGGAPCQRSPECDGGVAPLLPEGVAQVLNNMRAGIDFARDSIRRNLVSADTKDEQAMAGLEGY